MAKRQRREKPAKMEQRKVRGPEWELQVKQTHPLLGQPSLHRAGSWGRGEKCIKEGSQDGLRPLLGRSALMPKVVFSFACQIKPSCNTGLPFQIFAAARENWGIYTLPRQPHEQQPARFLCLWNFPGKNTGVGCHFFLQGISWTQGLNPHLLSLLHFRWILYH